MNSRKALGKGLEALIPDFEMGVPETPREGDSSVLIDEIVPNRNQPRKYFDDEKLQGLVDSIREKGVLQPIMVQRSGGGGPSASGSGYELIMGERRWRAAKQAGLKKIPVVIKEVSDAESLELAIIENIHRQDLNPIEEATAYSKLVSEFGLKQEQIAQRVGKNRASIANYMRLLKLSRDIQEDIITGRLTMGHARALLALPTEKAIEALRQKIIQNDLNVRQTEALAQKSRELSGSKPKTGSGTKNIFLKNLEVELERSLGTKVELAPSKKGGRSAAGGKVIISYYSDDDLERIRGMLVSKIA